MPRRFSSLPLLVLCAALAASAQQPPAPPPQDPAPAASNAAATPAPPAPPAKKSKKVWTNDDLPTLSGTSVSVVGAPPQPAKNSSPRPNSQAAREAAREKELQIARLREALRKLRADLAQLDKQIADLHSFQQGTPSSSPGLLPNRRPNSASPEDQLRQLTAKRAQLQSQLDTLEDAARKAGLSPGDLR
ncbi:MAG: hypothetical protein LAN84_08310 [Acidobacteriia bacterium]|nr:hypothetical protein [Terriglobia bacterium]